MQNACNLAWALSVMRHRPSVPFFNGLQLKLQKALRDAPATVHPQNVGDMLQALAVLRMPLADGLASDCRAWMVDNVARLLPNHILAYLNVRALHLDYKFCHHLHIVSVCSCVHVVQPCMWRSVCREASPCAAHDRIAGRLQGMALLGDLGRSDFQFFADGIQINMGSPTPLEWQSYAHRIYVLAHLVYEDAPEGEAEDEQSECGFLCYSLLGICCVRDQLLASTQVILLSSGEQVCCHPLWVYFCARLRGALRLQILAAPRPRRRGALRKDATRRGQIPRTR